MATHADYTRTVDSVQVGEVIADDATYSRLRVTERRKVRDWVSFTAIHLDSGAPVERTWSASEHVTVFTTDDDERGSGHDADPDAIPPNLP